MDAPDGNFCTPAAMAFGMLSTKGTYDRWVRAGGFTYEQSFEVEIGVIEPGRWTARLMMVLRGDSLEPASTCHVGDYFDSSIGCAIVDAIRLGVEGRLSVWSRVGDERACCLYDPDGILEDGPDPEGTDEE